MSENTVIDTAINVREGILLRKDLIPPLTLTHHFTKIRNILAGQAEGMTLDQTIVTQIIDILLCKIYDEQTTEMDKPVKVQYLKGETTEELSVRISTLFEEIKRLPEVGALFRNGETLEIQGELLREIIIVLQPFELTNAGRDIVGEAFETFIGPSLRGDEGQFFTPRNVVELICKMLNPKPGEVVVDPACGTGGFLTQAIRNYSSEDTDVCVYGIDKDSFLARVAAIQIGLVRKDSNSWAYNANSLAAPHSWPSVLLNNVTPGTVDVIMTNPPFGSKITIALELLQQFTLGKTWKRKKDGTWDETSAVASNRPPQILFIERCLELLKPGGRMGIVLPDGILGNQKEGYVRNYILSKADLIAIIDLPLETFMPSTSTKTSVIFLRKKGTSTKQENIFMAMAEKCGHDRRGKEIFKDDGTPDDDLQDIALEYEKWRVKNASDF